MTKHIGAEVVKAWLSDGAEIALIDVREHGQYGEGHPLFAVSVPYSSFEMGIFTLVPNPRVRLVLCDAGDGVAERAADAAEAMGYANVFVLAGGVDAWREAGYMLYAGVNVPSKAFGELVEHTRGTPRVAAKDLKAMQDAGENMVIVDGRTFAEFQRMSIPGGISCPNGELALRIGSLVPDPTTRIIVNCAGRTRSIIGAQTLIDLGIPNPVYALENGTQGWFLAGLQLDHGASRRHGPAPATASLEALRSSVRRLAEERGVAFVAAEEVARWLADPARTTYLLDVRTPEEFAGQPVRGFVHAPGGQLVQAADQWIGVRGARIVLLDAEQVRAPMTAQWLRQQGHEAYVLEGGIAAAGALAARSTAAMDLPEPASIAPEELAEALGSGGVRLIDLRFSMSYRKEHVSGAVWSIRPRIPSIIVDPAEPVVLIADRPGVATLAALDLAAAGVRDVRQLAGGQEAARAAGLPMEAAPELPVDADCIDFLFFTAARHDGDATAARQYLAWELGLVDQLDAQERAAFRL
ncbi:MAG TPA: rhodanese-like domain-containing protein [Hyphomicrobiaceae bacterium]|nr:rhodanese-like domain-containing protein [Hyphomicrobiaceae bacterium]